MTLEDLGRRAVACKHWRFLPGMRIVGYNTMGRPMSFRLLNIPGSEWPEFWVAETRNAHEVTFMKGVEEAGFLPDLSDPATLGCLLALVREAYEGDCEWAHELSLFFDATAMGWRVGVILKGTALIPYAKGCSLLPFESEAEALVAALEAAP